MSNRIGIAGISGRMGRLVAAHSQDYGTLVGGTSRTGLVPDGVALFADIAALAEVSDIVIDFTHASTVSQHAAAFSAARTAWVLGTTGYNVESAAAIREAARYIPIIAAPNFCTGINLLLLLAERLGVALPAAQYDAEILEMHHRQKIDAPSGTALALGQAVATGRGVAFDDLKAVDRSGARKPNEIGFATLRGGQIVGSHSVLFTAGDEQITLTHHAFDRAVFAIGALRASAWLAGKPPGLYEMRDVLGL